MDEVKDRVAKATTGVNVKNPATAIARKRSRAATIFMTHESTLSDIKMRSFKFKTFLVFIASWIPLMSKFSWSIKRTFNFLHFSLL